MLSSLVRFRPNRFVRRRWFWLLNGVLLLLYLWTLTGQTRVAVTVNNGVCTAIVPGRTVQVECPQLRAGSRVGLYLQNPEPEPKDILDVRDIAAGHVVALDRGQTGYASHWRTVRQAISGSVPVAAASRADGSPGSATAPAGCLAPLPDRPRS